MARITIRKIAEELGLSVAAVSTALGTQSTSKVSQKTAERVRAYADKVNYRPSLASKSMRSQRLQQVGILVEPNFDPNYRQPPIVDMPIIFGLNDFLAKQEWQLNIIDDGGKRPKDEPLPRYLRERFLDGLVVSSTSSERNQTLVQDFARFSIPSVFLNAAGKYNCVTLDDRAGAVKATRHLLDLGHRKIVFVGTKWKHCSMAERERGFTETMEAAGLKAPIYQLHRNEKERQIYEKRLAFDSITGRQFVEEYFLRDHPTGIVCYDDSTALVLMRALHHADISVPGDVSIVGFNDIPFMDMLPTSLTTIRADFYTMGQLAGKLLLDLIHQRVTKVPSPVITPELVVRESTGKPAKKRSSK